MSYPTPLDTIRDSILPTIAGAEHGSRAIGGHKTAEVLFDVGRKLKAVANELEKNWIRRPEPRP